MIEVVTHCWSGDAVPVYHLMLQWQLNSIVTFLPETSVQVTVVCTSFDYRTKDVLKAAAKAFKKHPSITLAALTLPKHQLFRRAIGRNMAAKQSLADVVWFTDCDYVFGPKCLDVAHRECLESSAEAVWPKHTCINKEHVIGDQLIQQDMKWQQLQLLGKHFVQRSESKAIGGLHIVKGDVCRLTGYLDNTHWVRPVNASMFKSCKCDVPFRQSITWKRVNIPALYRLRHTYAGRDGGKKKHVRQQSKSKKRLQDVGLTPEQLEQKAKEKEVWRKKKARFRR